MAIDDRFRRLWDHITPVQRSAFICCFIAGYLAHLFAFTNIIPNSDGLSRVFELQQMTIAGRWFLHSATAPSGFTQMPAAIGLLSMLFLSLAAALTVDLLGYRSRMLAGLSGVLMAVFPALGYTFLYMFTASAYCISIFLAVLSVWLAEKGGRIRIPLASAVLSLSMGTYQAYVTLAIGLCLLVVLRRVLDTESTFRGTLELGIRFIVYLAAGGILYYVILQIFLRVKHLELWAYLGMDAASSGYPFSRLPTLIAATYKQVASFFFLPGAPQAFTTPVLVLLDLVALVLGISLFLTVLRGKKLWMQHWRPITSLIMLALLPLGINFIQILSPYSVPTPLVKYAFVLPYLAVLLVADLCDSEMIRGCFIPITAGWTALLLLFFLNTNNIIYTASSQAHRATESYMTRLMARIEECPGYRPGMELVIIGTVPEDQLRSQIESYARVDHYSVPLNHLLSLNKHIYYYLEDWLNIPAPMPPEETMIAVSDSDAFQSMPLYPSPGSIQVLDNRVVVKLMPQYTPKSQFELDYENRH